MPLDSGTDTGGGEWYSRADREQKNGERPWRPGNQSRPTERDPRGREVVPADARAELVLDTADLAWWDQCFVAGKVKRSPRWAEMLGYAPGEIDCRLEVYLREHADLEFSHGLCPDCVDELYPDFSLKT